MKSKFKCILHGSFRKHFDEIKRVHKIFTRAGIEVLAPALSLSNGPELSEVKSIDDGFAVLESDREKDQRMIELLYLHNLKKLGENGFSYFINPEGYIGKSASYELGIAQISNIRCFFNENLSDHPAYIHKNAVLKPELLAEYIFQKGELPEPKINRNEKIIHKLWEGLMVPGSVVAVGGIIEHVSSSASRRKEKEILLVKTHKWGNKY